MGCGGILGTVAGAGLGFVASGGNPLGAMAGANIGGALGSGMESGNAAQTQADAASSTANTQNAIASQQWDRYLKTFAPVEDKLVAEATKPIDQQAGYLKTMGTIDRGFANQEANLRRTMGGRYPSGAGLSTMGQTGLDLNRIKTKAGATSDYNVANNANLLNLANLGRGLPATAIGGLSSSGAMSANLAGMYGNAAASTYGGMGNMAGNLMQAYLISNPGMFKNNTGPGDGATLKNYGDWNVDPSMVGYA